MQIKAFTFNPFQENTYILYDETKECVIIDPGCNSVAEQNQLKQFIEKEKLKPVRLLNTHCHLDHIFGNHWVAETYGLPLEANEKEIPMLSYSEQASAMYGVPMQTSPAIEIFLTEKDIITFGTQKLSILFTPGHSPGSICFYHKESNCLIAGDVLFRESIGRTDLPMGNHEDLLRSIKTKLFLLPKETKVYSGHGISTTIGYEMQHNPFF